MNYLQEISYRNEILMRVRNRKKITQEERFWLETHRIINRNLGYPYLNADIIHLLPNTNYRIRIYVEKLIYPYRIIPVITVPGEKGKIAIDALITDHNGKETSKKTVKMLGVLVDSNHNTSELTYQSDLGLLGVSYECDYYDDKQHILVRKNSSMSDPNFAMHGKILADNKMRYSCKSPTSDSFDSFVFTIEWECMSNSK